jgi:hypothetical protein
MMQEFNIFRLVLNGQRLDFTCSRDHLELMYKWHKVQPVQEFMTDSFMHALDDNGRFQARSNNFVIVVKPIHQEIF